MEALRKKRWIGEVRGSTWSSQRCLVCDSPWYHFVCEAISPPLMKKAKTLESHSISWLPLETLPRCYSLSAGKEHAQLCLSSSLFWWYVGEPVFSSGPCTLSSLGLSASASLYSIQTPWLANSKFQKSKNLLSLLNFCHPGWTILNRQASYGMIVSSGIYCLWVRSLSWSKT